MSIKIKKNEDNETCIRTILKAKIFKRFYTIYEERKKDRKKELEENTVEFDVPCLGAAHQ